MGQAVPHPPYPACCPVCLADLMMLTCTHKTLQDGQPFFDIEYSVIC